MTERFERFTERARKSLELAQQESARLKHSYLGTEHILLGLVAQENTVAARVLKDLGIAQHKVRASVESIIGRGGRLVGNRASLTPGAKHVLEYAVEESRLLNLDYVGTEHLLLGLVREPEGVAAGILALLGADLANVREATRRLLESGENDAGQPAGKIVRSLMSYHYPLGGQSLEILRTLYDHAVWARDRLLPLVKSLEIEQLTSAEHKGVYGSIHDTFAHMASSEWMWLQRCQGESPMRIPNGEDFKDLLAIVVWWNEVHAQADTYLSSLSDQRLETEVTYLGPDGKRRTRKVWHMLLQVPNHQTDHRSQIATMLGSMGLEVPQTDLVVFLSERG